MRNILVFPDGYEEHFMYPKDRIIPIGETFEVTEESGVVFYKVSSIKKEKYEVYFILEEITKK